MSEPTTYTIKTVFDFLSIPPDRRDVACSEFKAWLTIIAAYQVILGDLFVLPEAFVWLDDDKGEVSVTITDSDGVEFYRASGVLA